MSQNVANLHGIHVCQVIMDDNTVFVSKTFGYIKIHLIKNTLRARVFRLFYGKWLQPRLSWGWGQNFVTALCLRHGRNCTQSLSSAVSAAENLEPKIKVLEFWVRTLYMSKKLLHITCIFTHLWNSIIFLAWKHDIFSPLSNLHYSLHQQDSNFR